MICDTQTFKCTRPKIIGPNNWIFVNSFIIVIRLSIHSNAAFLITVA